jgi:hypothetical protein
MSDSNSNSGGIGLAGATFIVFLVLKLTHNIDWSWWWVTSPLWIPAVLVSVIVLIAGISVGVKEARQEARIKKRRTDRLRKL